MATALRTFAVVSAGRSMVFREGQEVPEAIAALYPVHIVGRAKAEARPAHNPALKARPTKREAGRLTVEELLQWIAQFHPGSVPNNELKKDELVELVLTLSGQD